MEEPSPDRGFVMSELYPRQPGEPTLDFSRWSLRDCVTTVDQENGRVVTRAIMMPGDHPVRFWYFLPAKE